MQKHVIRALSLSLLAAVGLMAFAAVGAQASEIRVLGSAVLSSGKNISGTQVGEGTLLVPALNIEVVCKTLKVLKGKIISGTTGEGLGEILYEGCVTWGTKTNPTTGVLELTSQLPCEILDGGTKAVGHITAKAKLLVVLHNSDTYILAEKDDPATHFTAYTYTPGKGCPIPLSVLISGSTVFKLVTGDVNLKQAEVKEPEIEASKVIGKLFEEAGLPGDKLLYGAQTAYIDGKAKLQITDVSHINCTWGAL